VTVTVSAPPVVVISPTGTQGPRGNAMLGAARPPVVTDGIDGDYWVDRTNYPTSVVMYGPKAAGTWPGTGVTIGASSGGGGAPTGPAGGALTGTYPSPTLAPATAATFDAAGAAASAQAAAVADAATKYSRLQPWVFDVTAAAYGAKGDGKVATDGAMTASSATLTCATSVPFTAGDVGKSVMVKGAGPTGVTTLVTTISAFMDTGHVTLATTAASTVSGALVMFASDDTAAFKAAINAAVAYAQGAGGAARVFVPAATGRFYGVAGALTSGGATLGNAQIPLPVVPVTGNKVTLTIEGASDGSGLQHWQQTVPTLSGSTLVSFGVFASSSAQTTSINAAGNACVIGGPSQPGGYGVAPGVFSNMNVAVRNLSILTAHSANGFTYTSMDLSGVANAGIENFAYGTTGTVAGNDYANPGTFATGLAIGLLLPASGNNDNVILRNVTCHGGYTYAVFATEHADIVGMRILYCWAGFCPVGSYYNSVGSTHAIVATLLSIEACTYVVYVIGQGSSGVGPFLHLRIDTETSTPRFGGNSSGAGLTSARGDIVLTGLYAAANLTLDAPCGFDIVNGQASYAAQAVAANYAVTTFDELITVDATSAARTITLPTAVGRARRVVVTKTDASANTVTVGTTASQTINGAATKTLTTQWATAEFLPSGGNWIAR
jgi:hypothetical protein